MRQWLFRRGCFYKLVKISRNRSLVFIQSINQLGGIYQNGKSLSKEKRKEIVCMAQNHVKPSEISRRLKVSHGCVSKILKQAYQTGSIETRNNGTRGRKDWEKKPRQPRTQFTSEQLNVLENLFQHSNYPIPEQINEIVKSTNLSIKCVKIWFCNRRLRENKKKAAQNNTLIEPQINMPINFNNNSIESQINMPLNFNSHETVFNQNNMPLHTQYTWQSNFSYPEAFQSPISLFNEPFSSPELNYNNYNF